MGNKYVWMILLLLTIYVLYSNGYKNAKLDFVHENVIAVFITLEKYLGVLFPSKESNASADDRIFTPNQLKKYTNVEDGLYLAILGQVYDVTRGEKHYGPGGTYHSFVGRDASLAFVTGDFTDEGLTDDVSSLTPSQIKSLNDWALFYAKDYVYKGKLSGRYYDVAGNPTNEYLVIREKLVLADREKSDEELRRRIFPSCNIEWKPDVGTRLWCTKKSGGVERDWVGVPRMLYEPGTDQHRCTCVNLNSKEYDIHKGNFREYEGCPKGATNCVVKNS